MGAMRAEIRLIRNSCTSHRIPLLDVGEMMHGGRHDGCCVCVTQIGLFMRSKSNINIALDTALAPLCVNVRIIGEGGAQPTLTSDHSSLSAGHWTSQTKPGYRLNEQKYDAIT